MRRALATTALTASLALGGGSLVGAPAYAAGPATTDVVVVAQTDELEDVTDEGDETTGDDEDGLGDWGLLGLLGLFGLFGYKKYKEHRASRTGTTNSGPVGDIDGDNSGSRRV